MNLYLEEQEINYLLAVLAERPFKESAALISKIQSQAKEQDNGEES